METTTTVEAQTADELALARRNAFVPCYPEQAKASLMLARAYGHEWAQKLRDTEENDNLLTRWLACKATIGEIVEFILSDNYGGGEAGPWPEGGESSNLTHTTGTGRTGWTVTADGTVIIEIRRPDQDGGEPFTVLSAEVNNPGTENTSVYWYRDGDTGSETAVPYGEVAFHERHVYAVRKAITALVGDWSAAEAAEAAAAEAVAYAAATVAKATPAKAVKAEAAAAKAVEAAAKAVEAAEAAAKAAAAEAVAPLWDLAIPEFDEKTAFDGLTIESFLAVAEKACRTATRLCGPAVVFRRYTRMAGVYEWRGRADWRIESRPGGFGMGMGENSGELEVCFPLPGVWGPEHETQLRKALAFADEFLGKGED